LSIDNQVDNGNVNNDQSNKSVTYYVDYQSAVNLPLKFKLTYGATMISTKTKSPLFSGEQSAGNRAVYIQLDQKWKKLSYTLGRRWENYTLNDYTETKPVFRAGMNYALGKATYLRASYGEGFRFPTIAESYIKTNVGLVSIYPNENLKSETGDNLEFGIKQGFKTKRIKGYLDFALFQMRYQNMMEFTFGQWSTDVSQANGLGVGFKSLNTGETTIKGLDVSMVGEARVFKKGKFRLFGGYTASLPTSDNPNKAFATDSNSTFPENQLSYNSTSWDTTDAILKYRSLKTFKMDASYSNKRIDAGVSWRYGSQIKNIDKAFVTPFFAFFVPGIEDGMLLNPKGTWVMDVRLAYKITSKYRVSVIVNNVMNKEYIQRPSDLGAPRMVMIQFKATI